MKIGVIGTEGGWSSETLADTVARRTGERILIGMDQVRLDLPSGDAFYNGHNLKDFDALIIKKIGARYSPDLLDRLEVLRYLAERGLKIFSSPYSILRVLDRLSCTITMQLANIPMPPTTITESVDQALTALEMYGEAVFKPLYTSKARGMFILENGPDARAAIEQYRTENPIMYIQKTIELGDLDLGIAFLGGEYLTTYARCKTNGAWNTTTESGGKYRPYEPSPEIIELAHKAQAQFDLDFTCVDVAITDDGPYVFEVSAFGGFRGIQETSGIDAAQRYVEYVMERI
ncbi:MAG: GAK system ATP-grasp enzyme [Pseudodesulfovibrio sp.]|uniref:RimK domain protein ATP-grasp n=1 Tax=Pseudodesulfovibrio aespoeensis (strain ATCC 700646 / DSM 10631 / Aspo-2) TaxID=643562 RepID=E6VTZ9_PSEA9|nr:MULTISPECIES: GAK system ATP-grasp enzyme [Pseudodesulfovibrio]MBU4378026.1 GAK system ATP-grasp enzyme [Pseudomonadota bacterium]MCG2734721.1 GAK system ATP-grasp enzyme [Pseudodesulfovibrio aespoeensis]ADU62192.1 RimK domain protein ATP-grasp [Pseudodesulfovibrio aespoeensis Aspo-2]MBU4476119.1 GAK system ATP-grasp enzyme [Pseudomonadota bacterium]MBU4515341.1 GAK system ATP-grasp enzyme [Pseudomonadota bacterium]